MTACEMRSRDWSSDVGSSDVDVAVVDPRHYLVRAVALLAERVGEKVFQPRTIEVQEVLLGGCFSHGIPVDQSESFCHGSRGSTRIRQSGNEGRTLPPLIICFIRVHPRDPWQKINQRTRSEEHTSELQSLMRN